MSSITTSADLKKAIQQLELQQANELILLKAEYKITVEHLKPLNLLKNAFKKAVTSPDLKTDVFNAAIGLTSGVLAKKLMVGKTINPLKKLLGIIVEMTVAKKVTKNADEIKSAGSMILNSIFHKKEQTAKP
ncbi:MAG: hypothetical protein ABI685_12300 [Ferruginibacter sp.]